MKSPLSDFTGNRRRIAIGIVVLAAYWPTLRMGFLWDDHVMIEANPALQSWSVSQIKQEFSTDPFKGLGDPYYRPLQTLMNRLDYAVWGLRPFGYHLTNLLFHAANSILLAELVIGLGFSPMAGLLAGCLFGVHPIGVEQLMIIAGRAELMTLCFTLINLLLFVEEGPWALGLGAIAYALALLSKENAIITPALFLLLAWYQKMRRPVWSRLWVYLAISIPYFFMRSHAVGTGLPNISPTLVARFLTLAFGKIAFIYLRLIVIPWNLHSHRMIPRLSHVWYVYLLGWAGFFFALMKKHIRWGLLSLGWFMLCFLPKTPAMITGNFTLDHWAYPSAIGVVLPIAIGLAWCWENHRTRWRYWLSMSFFPLLAAWALLVHLNIQLRGTDEKMYRWALHFTGSHPIKYNLGVLLLQSGRANESLEYFQDVLSLYPEDLRTAHAIAVAYYELGHVRAATYMLKQILKSEPSNPAALEGLRKIQEEQHHKTLKK